MPRSGNLTKFPRPGKSWRRTYSIIPDNILNICPHTHPFIKETSLCDRWESLKKTTTNQHVEWRSTVPRDTSTMQLLKLRVRDHQRRESGKTVRLGGLGVFSEAMSPGNGTSYTIKEYQSTRLANHVPNEDNRHASMDGRKPRKPRAYTNSYKSLTNAGGSCNSFLQGHALLLGIR